MLKLSKVNHKERILRQPGEKRMVTYKRIPMSLSSGFSTETLQDKRVWNDILKILKDKKCHPRILFPAKLLFGYEGETKTFPYE